MKHWGLQFENRIKEFGREVAYSRVALTGVHQDIRAAQSNVIAAQNRLTEAQQTHSLRKKALDKLIDLGPEGLARLEREDGPELGLAEFIKRCDISA